MDLDDEKIPTCQINNLEVGSDRLLKSQGIVIGLDGALSNREQLFDQCRGSITGDPPDSDLECLLIAYKTFDEEFLNYLDGQFSLFLADSNKNKFVVARDPLGYKPLFWYQNEYTFLFASDIKALLISGLVSQTPSIDAFAAYMTLGYFPQDFSPIEGVNKLLPAHALWVKGNQEKRMYNYWSLSACFQKESKPSKDSSDEAKFQTLLKQACSAPLTTRPIGCAVSNDFGADVLAYYLGAEQSNPYVVGYSSSAAECVQEDHYLKRLRLHPMGIPLEAGSISPGEAIEALIPLVWQIGEPLADPLILLKHELIQRASNEVGTLYWSAGYPELCGEAYGGTLKGFEKKFWSSYLKESRDWLLKEYLIPTLAHISPQLACRMFRLTHTSDWYVDYLSKLVLFDKEELTNASPACRNIFDVEIFFHKFHHAFRVPSNISMMTYFDLKTGLPERTLLPLERFSSLYHLNLRMPFLDRSIIEWLAEIPPTSDPQTPNRGHMLSSLLPHLFQEHFTQAKIHNKCEPFRGWVEEPIVLSFLNKLKNGALVENGYLCETWLESALATPMSRSHHFLRLWSFLVWEIWFRLFINRPIRTTIPKMTLDELFE